MTLKDTLNDLKGQAVKIGARAGFVFCGKVDNATIFELTNLSQQYLQPALDRHQKKIKEKSVFNEVWDKKFEEMQERIKTKHPIIEPELFGKYYNRFENERDKAWNKLMTEISELENEIFCYQNFPDREVIKTYDSFCDADKIIIIAGTEQGKHWLISDYQKEKGAVA